MDCLQPPPYIYRIITQPIAVISFPTYLTVFLALTFLKSDVSRKYQLFLIWNVIENFALDVYLIFFLVPAVHSPYILFRGTGLLSHLGFSGTIQFLITCLIVNIHTLYMTEIFYYRYQSCIFNYKTHKFSYFVKSYVYLIRTLIITTSIFHFATYQDATKIEAHNKLNALKQNKTDQFLNCSSSFLLIPFTDYVSTFVLGAWIFITVILTFSLPITALYINISIPRSTSHVNWKIQKQLLKRLVIQFAVHEILMGIPHCMFIYAVLFGYQSETLAYSGFVSFSYHGIASTLSIIFLTKPLRNYILTNLRLERTPIVKITNNKCHFPISSVMHN